MNRKFFLVSTVPAALLLGLAACGGTTPAGGAAAAGMLNADYENALPVESQLILGTLLLEDTENAVTAEQAAELLPMWQLLKELTTSDTAADSEREGLLEQIQETMTADQLRVIADMQLTQQDMFDYMQKAGLVQMPQQSGTPDASSGGGFFPGGMEGGAPPADFEGGGPPSGSGGQFGGGNRTGGGEGGYRGQDLSPEQLATMEARRASRGGFGGSPTVLLDALIQMLEGKQAA
jgi:hypothetical protein